MTNWFDSAYPNRMVSLTTAFSFIALLLCATTATAIELDGFTEPSTTIIVASSETGLVAEALVEEGESVREGQPLARLNSDVHQALLRVAEHNMRSEGRIQAAIAEVGLRSRRLEKLEALRTDGHARQEEVDRARSELDVARANLTAAQEDQISRRLEFEKVQVQVRQRTVFSPIDGVVTAMHREVGEFVAPNHPDLLTVVKLDPLMANFTVMSHEAKRLQLDQRISVVFPNSGQENEGVVDFVAPVTDAESGTVRVKIRIPNPDNQLRSGERCNVILKGK